MISYYYLAEIEILLLNLINYYKTILVTCIQHKKHAIFTLTKWFYSKKKKFILCRYTKLANSQSSRHTRHVSRRDIHIKNIRHTIMCSKMFSSIKQSWRPIAHGNIGRRVRFKYYLIQCFLSTAIIKLTLSPRRSCLKRVEKCSILICAELPMRLLKFKTK